MPDSPALERQLCFALYSASRALTARYRPLLEELGLTYPQYLVTMVLLERGTMSVGELGRALVLDSGTLSPLLKRMEAAGIVRRSRSADDERSVVVELTERGHELRSAIAEMPKRVYADVGIPVEDLVELHARLGRLLGAIG